jgi:hypothetical protein
MHINYNFDNESTTAYKYLERLNLKDFLEDLRKYDENLYYILKIYYTHFLVMAGFDEDDSNYWTLRKLVDENLHQFSRFEKYNLLLFLESCASVKIKEGKTAFVQEIHEIHKIMLERNLYESLDTNYMNLVRFWKIINNAISLKKFDWTENFIKDYSEKLLPEIVHHMKNYSYSLLSFAKGDYQKSLEYAAKVKSFEYLINYSTKVLKLKCFCELGYLEEAIYSVDSYKHSLRKDTTSPDWIKTRFSNFINYYVKMLMIKEEADKSVDAGILRIEISKETEILEKHWLLEKVQGKKF